MKEIIDWAESIGCAATVCDKDCRIIYMNELSRRTFAKNGDIIGQDLMLCHPPHARKKIAEMLSNGSTNAYTIHKKGIKKLIFQSPWRKDGEIAGLVELSIPLPEDMPHYDRDQPSDGLKR